MPDIDCNTWRKRERLITALALMVALGLILALFAQAFRNPGISNYGLLSEAFLQGRLHVADCAEDDCVRYGGLFYVPFPPFPAIVAVPFVAAFGADFKGFVALAAAMSGAAIFVWYQVFRHLGLQASTRIWLLTALTFASPVYMVTFGARLGTYFALSTSFLCLSLSLWAVVVRARLLLGMVFLGCAFLCRQMTIFWFPALVALSVSYGSIQHRRGHLLLSVLKAGSILGAFFVVYLLYNYARFGNPLETGYSFINNPNPVDEFFNDRIREIGLFSYKFFLQNLLYLFVQGFHVEFAGQYLTEVKKLDPFGTSILSASPWILIAAYLRIDRVSIVVLFVIALIVSITLFYHGNGYQQVNMQRFVLDWLPLLVLLIARSPRSPVHSALPLLVTWGMGLNSVALVVMASV